MASLVCLALCFCAVLGCTPASETDGEVEDLLPGVYDSNTNYDAGDPVRTESGYPMDIDSIDSAVWILSYSIPCLLEEHIQHDESCFELKCGHHTDECYNIKNYSLCNHSSDSEHTAVIDSAKLFDITIIYNKWGIPTDIDVSWKKHPATEVAKAYYNQLDKSGEDGCTGHGFLECKGKTAIINHFLNAKFCSTDVKS